MASTKEMMARAKARRQAEKQPQRHINEHKFTELMVRMADFILEDNPQHDYGQTDHSLTVAKLIVENYTMGQKELTQLISFRERFEQGLSNQYGVELATGMGAFVQDQEAHLKSQNVPQNIRVLSGLLDTLISVVAVRTGAIEFNF